MKLLMHVLKKNTILGIDNETITLEEIKDKLSEEFSEVVDEIWWYSQEKSLSNLKKIVKEGFDLLQVLILLMWKCHREAKNFGKDDLIQECNFKHKDKLISERGWIIETGIEIDIKE